MNDDIDQLVEMGALADVRGATGERDHQALVDGLVAALRPSVLRFARGFRLLRGYSPCSHRHAKP